MIFEFFLWWKLWYHLHTTFFEEWLALGFDKVFPRPNQLCHCIVSKYQLHSMLLRPVLLKTISLLTFRPVLFDFRPDLRNRKLAILPWNRPSSVPNDEKIGFNKNLVSKNSRFYGKKVNFRFRDFDRKPKSTPCKSVQPSRKHIKTACDDPVKQF